MTKKEEINKVDIIEDYIYVLSPELLDVLLKDRSSKKNCLNNRVGIIEYTK